MTFSTVSGYLMEWVGKQNGSTKSVTQIVSQLKTQSDYHALQWLSPQDASALRMFVAQLRFEDTSEVRRMSALRFHILLRVIESWDLSDIAQLQRAAMLMLTHNALLRSGEVSNRLRASDVEWSAGMRGFRLRLLRTKTGRTGGGVFVDVAYCRHPLSGFQLVRRLWRARDLDQHPLAFLFPAIRRGFLVLAQPASASSLRLLVKAVVVTAGFDPSMFSGHSLRAGGATDLFASRVPYYTIKKMGRWRSETALIYFRSVDDVARTVARAFDKIGARCKR